MCKNEINTRKGVQEVNKDRLDHKHHIQRRDRGCSTWQGFVCAHVTDGYNESVQTMTFSLSIKLGQDYGMV